MHTRTRERPADRQVEKHVGKVGTAVSEPNCSQGSSWTRDFQTSALTQDAAAGLEPRC